MQSPLWLNPKKMWLQVCTSYRIARGITALQYYPSSDFLFRIAASFILRLSTFCASICSAFQFHEETCKSDQIHHALVVNSHFRNTHTCLFSNSLIMLMDILWFLKLFPHSHIASSSSAQYDNKALPCTAKILDLDLILENWQKFIIIISLYGRSAGLGLDISTLFNMVYKRSICRTSSLATAYIFNRQHHLISQPSILPGWHSGLTTLTSTQVFCMGAAFFPQLEVHGGFIWATS